MIIAVTGGRHYGDMTHVYKTLDYMREKYGPFLLHHGDATGADALAHQWAVERGYKWKQFDADWNRFGFGAGPIRNAKMITGTDLLVAFPGNRGTKNAIKNADKQGIEVYHA